LLLHFSGLVFSDWGNREEVFVPLASRNEKSDARRFVLAVGSARLINEELDGADRRRL